MTGCDQEPGEAVVQRTSDGPRMVVRADPVIRVSAALLSSPYLEPDVIEPDGTLRLDTAGEYRYRYVRHEDENTLIYERITETRPQEEEHTNDQQTADRS